VHLGTDINRLGLQVKGQGQSVTKYVRPFSGFVFAIYSHASTNFVLSADEAIRFWGQKVKGQGYPAEAYRARRSNHQVI